MFQGLPVSGNKQDLIERLQTSGDLLDDDLLDQVRFEIDLGASNYTKRC